METQTTNGTAAKATFADEETSDSTFSVTGTPTLAELERRYITLILEKTGGNKVKAAQTLGVSVKTIYNKLNSYETAETVRNSTQGS